MTISIATNKLSYESALGRSDNLGLNGEPSYFTTIHGIKFRTGPWKLEARNNSWNKRFDVYTDNYCQQGSLIPILSDVTVEHAPIFVNVPAMLQALSVIAGLGGKSAAIAKGVLEKISADSLKVSS